MRSSACRVLIAAAAVLMLAATRESVEQLIITPEGGGTRIHQQPGGRFAAVVFGEDALGSYLAVMYFDAMTNPVDGPWSLANRVWQNEEWSNDLTNFAWDTNGRVLYVATGAVYGTGKVYRLDLKQRLAREIYTPPADRLEQLGGTRIVALDPKRGRLSIAVEYTDKQTPDNVIISTR